MSNNCTSHPVLTQLLCLQPKHKSYRYCKSVLSSSLKPKHAGLLSTKCPQPLGKKSARSKSRNRNHRKKLRLDGGTGDAAATQIIRTFDCFAAKIGYTALLRLGYAQARNRLGMVLGLIGALDASRQRKSSKPVCPAPDFHYLWLLQANTQKKTKDFHYALSDWNPKL